MACVLSYVLHSLVHAHVNLLCTGCRGSLAGPNEDTHTASVWSRLRVTTRVEVMLSLNVFNAFFHWSVPEKMGIVFICIVSIHKKEKPKEGKQHFFFHKL